MLKGKSIKGMCGADFVQGEPMMQGEIHLSCSIDSDYWIRTTFIDTANLQKECKTVCVECRNNLL